MPIPLFSSLVANRRTTIIWSIIIFLSLIAVAPFDSTFSQLAYYVSPTFSLVNAVLNITVLLVLVVSANLYLLAQLDAARERADRLLLNVLPKPIAERLKRHPGTIADSYTEATVLFADIVGFTQMSAHANPVEVVNLLNEIFSDFDKLAAKHDLEKIKTIGDAYMVVGGLPATRADNAQAVMELAIDLLDALKNHRAFDGEPIHVRVGINTGPVVAGVIGQQKFIYDLWGDTVNTASRMEANSMADFIQVTETTYNKIREQYLFEKREPINVKGKGLMTTYLFKGRLAPQDPRQQSFRVVQV